MSKIKVLIIDDSKKIQARLSELLTTDREILIVGIASDPYMARELIKSEKPDVVTLDVIMPHMDGITFLKNLMRLHPMPVIMISNLTASNTSIALEARALGAVDCLPKPEGPTDSQYENYRKKLVNCIKLASRAKVKSISNDTNHVNFLQEPMRQSDFLNKFLIVMGASTGGIEALEYILSELPKLFPPILVVQHIRKKFSKSLANRMNSLFNLNIKEAEDNEIIYPGNVYMAPGDKHLYIDKLAHQYICSLNDAPPLDGHKPAIDLLFKSAVKVAHKNVIGIILSGMGNDGTLGAIDIHQNNGIVIAQDENSSVVWGMPGSAVKAKAVNYVVPLSEIPKVMFNVLDDLS